MRRSVFGGAVVCLLCGAASADLINADIENNASDVFGAIDGWSWPVPRVLGPWPVVPWQGAQGGVNVFPLKPIPIGKCMSYKRGCQNDAAVD